MGTKERLEELGAVFAQKGLWCAEAREVFQIARDALKEVERLTRELTTVKIGLQEAIKMVPIDKAKCPICGGLHGGLPCSVFRATSEQEIPPREATDVAEPATPKSVRILGNKDSRSGYRQLFDYLTRREPQGE